MGVLKYTPEVARSMTIAEANIAIDGHMLSSGAARKKLMSRNELLDLVGKRGNG